MSPEVLICDQCGAATHDDVSTIFETAGTGETTVVCFDCAPPDEED